MHEIINSIVSEIPVGVAFDAHFVIDTIIRKNSDDYLIFASSHTATSKTTQYIHSKLSKIIASFEGVLIERMEIRSHSYNIRGNASDCTLWQRIS
jgi:hypothetical protein